MHYLTVAGHQLMAWSFGIAATIIFHDLGPGFARDHPPLERRAAGLLTGSLAVLSFLALAVDNPYWVSLLIVAPFAVMASLYSLAWYRGWRADRRRMLGWQTGVIGAAALLVLMLTAGPRDWHGGTVVAAYAGSAGLLGGLTYLVLKSVYGRRAADAASPYGIPARAVAFGLGIIVLAALELLVGTWFPVVGLWLVLSLLIPALVMALGHLIYPRVQPLLWVAALLSALGGQAAIHTLTLVAPGLVPPAML